ncbi:hypothetical protein LY90DRAFT_676189 [Neocallimastix californiae]|uniref:Uncharacterized protein n=1 Tax=Neocallimastix californiae TaxID=1754190 RepID=A0A1Y2AGI5_9FUNG|nr:hypothetical protein LY90DRAFT_676189 [Neocallimastix californiae]|eukprot:ORY21616.1 hypothetical protein LY90DRAFT_676189 [Neocallimastix californiae]
MTSCKRTILIIILKAIKKFEDHQIFQITAFFSLSHLLCIHDAANSEIISKYKGVELILTAMKRFPYHISLQTTACFALESIIINHENHRKEFLELDGIDIILNVMRFDFSTLKKRRSNYENGQNDISDTIDENENIDVSITLDIDSSSESLFYSKYKDNSFHSFSKELLLQLFGSVALLNASDNKQCKEMIIKKGCLHYIYLASRKVASCNDLWLVLYYVFTRFSNSNENTETKSIYMKPHGVPTLLELCSKKIINKYTHNANKANLKNYDSQKTLIGTSSSSKEIREVEVDIALENNRNDEQGENINLVLVDEENHNITIIPSENNTINHNDNDSLSSSSSTITSISMNEEDIINNDLNIGEEEMIGNNDQNLNWLNNPLYTNNNYNSNSSINTPRNSNLTNNSIDTNNNMNIEENIENKEEVNNDENHDDINDNQSLDKLVKENPLLEQQKTEEWKQNEVKYLNSLPISGRVQDYLLSREYCCICGKACFESCVRLYSINRKKDCRLVYMCSVECAKKDSQFNKRAFYHVYPETAQIWWYEKQQEALKSKKNFKLKI